MKWLILTVNLMVLGACSEQAVDPVGTYLLDTAGKSFALRVQSDGNYSLKIDQPGRVLREIRGRWEAEDDTGRMISLSGLVWPLGSEPLAGNGIWFAQIEGSDRKICLEAEGLTCFVRADK